MSILLNPLIISMNRESLSDLPLSNINNMRLGTAMPNDVDTDHSVKMMMAQIDGIELTPNIALALHPVNIHRMSPYLCEAVVTLSRISFLWFRRFRYYLIRFVIGNLVITRGYYGAYFLYFLKGCLYPVIIAVFEGD